MNIQHAFLPLLGFFINILLAGYIFYKNPRNKINKIFSLYSLELGAWCFVNFLLWTAQTIEAASLWQKFWDVLVMLFPVTWLQLTLAFTKNKLSSKKLFYLTYLHPLVFGLLIFATNLAEGTLKPSAWGYNAIGANATPLVTLGYVIVIAMFIISLYLLYRFYVKTTNRKEKIQARLFLVAMSILFMSGLMTEIASLYDLEVFSMPVIIMPVYVLIVAYGIVRHGLMNITSVATDKIVETISDCLIVVDNDFRVAFANNSFLSMVGKNKDEIVGLALSDISAVMENKIKQSEDKDIRDYGTEIVDKDGKTVPVSINVSAIKDRQKIIGFVIVMRNISHTKDLIKNLEENNEALIRFKRLTVGRELKMIELKKEIERLKKIAKET